MESLAWLALPSSCHFYQAESMLLSDRVALVTGASRGLGAAIAAELARGGAAVCVNYRQNSTAAASVVAAIEAAGGRAFAHRADVTVAEDVDALVAATIERFGRLDIVVNNALPPYSFDPAAEYTRIATVRWEHFDRQLQGAVRGVLHTTQAALPHLAVRGGSIVNIATNLIYNPVVTYYDYTTAKAAMLGLTRNLAAELGPQRIRVNLLAGGLLEVTDASRVTTPEVFDYIRTASPLRTVVTPEEFARTVTFFASEMSVAITGQSLAVDGGLTMA